MSAPLRKSSGAPVAQAKCATAGFPPRLKPAAQKRATAALPLAQQQQAGFYQHGGNPAATDFAAMQHGEASMKDTPTEQLIAELVELNDELYARGESPIAIIREISLRRRLKKKPQEAGAS